MRHMLCALLVVQVLLLIDPVSATLGFPPYLIPEIQTEEMLFQIVQDARVWVFVMMKNDKKKNKQVMTMWENVAKKAKQVVQVGAVDVDSELGQQWAPQLMQSTSEPSVFLAPSGVMAQMGQQMGLPKYQGTMEVEPILKWAYSQIPSFLVSVVDNEKKWDNFKTMKADPSLPAAPMAVLFNNKEKTSPILKSLSLSLIQKMKVADVRVGKYPELAEQYGVTTFPALVVIPTEPDAEPIQYEGKSFGFVECLQFLQPLGLSEDLIREKNEERQKEFQQQQQAKEDEKKRKEEMEAAKMANPIPRTHTLEMWKEMVLDRALTIVAFLDPSDAYHQDNLKMLKKVYLKLLKKGKPQNMVWVHATQQMPLATSLGVAEIYPTVAFVNPKKGWYKNLIGSFTEAGIVGFTQTQLLKGTGKPFSSDSIPAFQEEANPMGLFELEVEGEKKATESTLEAQEKAEPIPTPPKKKPATKPKSTTPKVESEAQKKKREEVEQRNAEKEAKKAEARKAVEEAKKKAREERERLIAEEKAEKERLKKEKKDAKKAAKKAAKEAQQQQEENPYLKALKKKMASSDEL